MLHTLSRSPWQCDVDALLRMLYAGDDLLLIQDGVFAAINKSHFVEIFVNAPITVSALKDDVEARGLIGKISARINIISYVDFVDLAIKQFNQMNW